MEIRQGGRAKKREKKEGEGKRTTKRSGTLWLQLHLGAQALLPGDLQLPILETFV